MHNEKIMLFKLNDSAHIFCDFISYILYYNTFYVNSMFDILLPLLFNLETHKNSRGYASLGNNASLTEFCQCITAPQYNTSCQCREERLD